VKAVTSVELALGDPQVGDGRGGTAGVSQVATFESADTLPTSSVAVSAKK
jgi:hypothetical protein